MKQVTIADFRNHEGYSFSESEYLFQSLHAALTFAYRYSGQQYSPSIMAQIMKGPGGSGKGLSGLDGAAQAGLIRGMLINLDLNEKNIIAAKFSSNEEECIRAKLSLVLPVMASLTTGKHSRRAIDTLIQKWFGCKVNIRDTADKFNLHRNTVGPMWREVRECLNGIWERAETNAYLKLQKSGLIP